MPNAAGSQVGLSYIEEVTPGTTPATPVFKEMRVVGNDLALSKDALLSDERRSDRQITDVRHGNRSVGGPIPFEFSADNFDDMLEAVLQGTWATGVLDVGVTQRHFTFERYHADIATYLRYLGCAVSTFNLSVVPNTIVTGSFGIVGLDHEVAEAAIAGSTYVAATTTGVMDSFSGTITEGGVANAYITEVMLSLDNGIAGDFAVGSDAAVALTSKRSNLTGTIGAYFRDKASLEKFINETESAIIFTLTDGTNTYTFNIPKIKYMGGNIPVSDDGSLIVSLPFQAIWDETLDTNLRITKA